MILQPMNAERILKSTPKLFMSVILLVLCACVEASGAGVTLEGRNKGDFVNWYAGNLQNWQELDFIP